MQNKQIQGCTRGAGVNKSLADQVLLRAYTCLLQNRPIQGCTQGSKVTRVWPTNCRCEHTHVCKNQLRLAPKESRVTRIWQISCCCTQGTRVRRVWSTKCCCKHCSTNCCCEHTHACCRTPTSQGLQGFGRPTATESMQQMKNRKMSQCRVASKARVTRVWPTKRGWKHTPVLL